MKKQKTRINTVENTNLTFLKGVFLCESKFLLLFHILRNNQYNKKLKFKFLKVFLRIKQSFIVVTT